MVGYSGSIPLDTSISITLLSEFKHLQTIQERPPTSNKTEKKQLRWAAVRVGNKHTIFGLVAREVAWNTKNDIMGFQEYPFSATPPGKKAMLLQIQAVKTVTDPPHFMKLTIGCIENNMGILRGTYEIKNNTILASFDLKFFSCEVTWSLSSTMKQQLEVTNTVEEILREIHRWYNILQGFAHPKCLARFFKQQYAYACSVYNGQGLSSINEQYHTSLSSFTSGILQWENDIENFKTRKLPSTEQKTPFREEKPPREHKTSFREGKKHPTQLQYTTAKLHQTSQVSWSFFSSNAMT